MSINGNTSRLMTAFRMVVTDVVTIFLFFTLFYVMTGQSVEFNNLLDPYYSYVGFILAVKLVTYYFTGVYRIIYRYAGIEEALMVAATNMLSTLLVFVILLIFQLNLMHPFWLFVASAFELAVSGLSKFVYRIADVLKAMYHKSVKAGIHTIIIGAGAAGKLVVDELNTNKKYQNYRVVAFFDDDAEKIEGTIRGIPVHGPVANIGDFIKAKHVQEVIIGIANLSPERLKEILSILTNYEVNTRRIELLSEGDGSRPSIQDIKIEDLLGRSTIVVDNPDIAEIIKNEVVLVTGAGGSIGSELCRQLITYHPKKLVMFDIYEHGVYDLQQEFKHTTFKHKIDTEIVVLIGSVYNKERLESVFKEHQPAVVLHAAAYKHVPLMEDSPVEAIRTNVIGTHNVVQLCDQYHVKRMTLVSTDKAVRPTNIMGATKQLAERIVYSYSRKSETKFSAVRFGNVLGSNGSVVPLFKKQIEEGGPVTVTDLDVTRYFMTIPEAVSLILQSTAYAKGGEIFIFDMGEPVKIIDLAEKMIKLSGYRPYKDIDIKIIGMRPGEKKFEELLLDKEAHLKTKNNKIFIEHTTYENGILNAIESISTQYEVLAVDQIKDLLSQFVEFYCEGE